jgi:methyl-accepting chemotaxis protein
MAEISAIAKATQQGVEGAVATATQLAALSDELRTSVSRFKVA